MRFALFKEVLKRQRRQKRKLNNGAALAKDGDGEGSEDESDGEESAGEQDPPARMSMPPQAPAKAPPKAQETSWNMDLQLNQDQPPAGPIEDGKIRPERLQLFRSRLANIFSTRLQDEEQVFLTDLLEFINEGLPTDALFGTAEATEACQDMQNKEELMISDGVVYKI